MWCACERLGILPPDVKPAWDDNTLHVQAAILAYSQTREYDESKYEAELAGAKIV